MVPFSKIIEQFVELNHQTGKRLDEQTKRIPNAETMANSMCKKKALDYNAEINKRIKMIHEHNARGKYKKDTPRQQQQQQQQPGPVGLDALVAAAVQALSVDIGPDNNIIGGTGMVDGEIEHENDIAHQTPIVNSNSPERNVNGAAAAVAVTPRTAEKRGVPGGGSVVHIRLLSNFKKGKHY